MLNAGTIQERLLFHLGILGVRVQFESGYYSRAGTNNARTVCISMCQLVSVSVTSDLLSKYQLVSVSVS